MSEASTERKHNLIPYFDICGRTMHLVHDFMSKQTSVIEPIERNEVEAERFSIFHVCVCVFAVLPSAHVGRRCMFRDGEKKMAFRS